MPRPSVRTGSARLRPERAQTAQDADGHSPSGPCPIARSSRMCCPPGSDSPPTPPLDFCHRLTPSFFLEGIAWRRPSNWLPGRSHRWPPSRPLETERGAPQRARSSCLEGGTTEALLMASSQRPPFPGREHWGGLRALRADPSGSDTTAAGRTVPRDRPPGTMPGPACA